ncbi:MAG: LPS export ABC transporter ATP-binding protein [Planctomycetes bacterium]|nr:LPS export ABC transporter ATP-binding protein [Planctomycetota bacterium]
MTADNPEAQKRPHRRRSRSSRESRPEPSETTRPRVPPQSARPAADASGLSSRSPDGKLSDSDPPGDPAPSGESAGREPESAPPRESPARTSAEASTKVKSNESSATLPEASGETSTYLLQVDGLTKSYGGRTVVHRVSFTVGRGEVIGLLGKNGAGKTTTFRMTIGMITPDAGTIHFSGHDITNLPMYRRARLGMGYLSQEPSVFRGLTTEQNLNAILELTPLARKERIRRRDELVEEFGLGKLLHSKAAVLSGGEKRRLEIARALIMQPKLILLDEPFSGVDPIAVQEIQQIIVNLKSRGIGILLTDHNVRETLNTTDRSFIILDGRIIARGDREAILSDANARKYYLGERFQM